MKRFTCPVCDHEVFFDSLSCLNCGTELAYAPDVARLVDLSGRQPCGNRAAIGCNWVARKPGEGAFCVSCAMTETIPDLGVLGNDLRWRRIEGAKRRLVYSLLRLDLPLVSQAGNALTFRLLADEKMPDGRIQRVLTGHDNGLVTLNVSEADDDRREKMRVEMGERYRTLLGHCRHEVGHFYYDVLVDEGGRRAEFEAIFGDPDQDYQEALDRHYREGPPSGWEDGFVSAYATTHPWEDFAETFAHWLHMTDGLETAEAYGLTSGPDPYAEGTVEALAEAWVPLSVAMNAMSRALGQPDLYPFVLAPQVIRKLGFIHGLMGDRLQAV
ncbi:zinc-binding metallopeptidase family protein [Rubellimicrobium arenae]|uniref:zinc-binding metallopeptidase family protein n=1 Tax=Rubellimicrobium arenae TaxID=2817372 RepID=UPI001B304CCE|nr:putative zinc-binding metallopeptidase [Rubellimicrobium arenae]